MKDMELIEQTYTQLKEFWTKVKEQGLIQEFDINKSDISVVHLPDGRLYPDMSFRVTLIINEYTSVEINGVFIDVSQTTEN